MKSVKSYYCPTIKDTENYTRSAAHALRPSPLPRNSDIIGDKICGTDDEPFNDFKRPNFTFVHRDGDIKDYIPLNIIVEKKSDPGQDTLIIIDPKIKNDG